MGPYWASPLAFATGVLCQMPDGVNWERLGIVSFLAILAMGFVTGRIVPGIYYQELKATLQKTIRELDDQRETTRMAVATMEKLAENIRKDE